MRKIRLINIVARIDDSVWESTSICPNRWYSIEGTIEKVIDNILFDPFYIGSTELNYDSY